MTSGRIVVIKTINNDDCGVVAWLKKCHDVMFVSGYTFDIVTDAIS
jgi:hypothetical protein